MRHQLAEAMLAYLCSGIYEDSRSNEDVEGDLLNGMYRLHWFATKEWVNLVAHDITGSNYPLKESILFEKVQRLSADLRNPKYEWSLTKSAADTSHEKVPSARHLLRKEVEFLQDEKQYQWNYTNGESL